MCANSTASLSLSGQAERRVFAASSSRHRRTWTRTDQLVLSPYDCQPGRSAYRNPGPISMRQFFGGRRWIW